MSSASSIPAPFMAARDNPLLEITPQVLLRAYACGIFPMAESADDPQLYWIEPQARGVLPLERMTVPRRLSRTIRQSPYEIRIDTDFEGVIEGCAASRPGRRSTWINAQIRNLYRELFRQGHCHTVEVWHEGRLAGGLYGVAIGGAFFGESMFSNVRDASKIALVYLGARLIYGGFLLLDTQFVTDHLRQFGTVEVEKPEFHARLDAAIEAEADYMRLSQNASPSDVLDIIAGAGGSI
jgi:leucyl/phenylalanyl-tRNA--protein transferase